MPVAIIAIGMLVLSIVLLIKKGRRRMLFTNLISMGAYELFLGLGAATADGWDGIGWILTAFVVGGIHLLVLFIMALALPDKMAQTKSGEGGPQLTPEETALRQQRIQKAMENLPAQDRAKARMAGTVASPAKEYEPIKTLDPEPALTEWEARQKRLLSKLDDAQGGELPFD